MRVSFQALALFFVGIAMSASDEEKIQDITLVKCPHGKDEKYCRDGDKGQVLPGKLGAAPGYYTEPDYFLLLWEWPYQLSWRSVDDGAVNVSIRAANYTLHKEYHSAGVQTLDFTMKDLAAKAVPGGNNITIPESNILACKANQEAFDSISISHSGVSYSYSIGTPVIVPYRMGAFIQSGFEQERALTKNEVNKKWRLGVGIGVGVGVPILMIASYVLGTRKGKKSVSKGPKAIELS